MVYILWRLLRFGIVEGNCTERETYFSVCKMSKKVDKEKNQHIHVYVRCRPQNALEKKANSQIVVETNQEYREVIVKERLCDKEFSKKFTFDRVFGPENTQLDLYKTVASPCVEEVLQGYNCTVFAYGQTGTGKTYTMQGMRSCETNTWEEDPEAGIVPRALHHLFDELKRRFPEFTVRVSFLELYNEELFDLLSSRTEGNKLRLYDDIARKGSVVIQGLSEIAVHTKEELYSIMELGTNRRKTASTLMNTDSSRSHTIFSITVHIRECTLEGEELLKTGKLNLVDLAGSECVGRSGAVDRRAREAGNINQSLLTLGRVITALVEKTPHIPYRESKLTRLLQDSLGGRTKTSIIATVSPAQCNLEETLSTLDYAHRAKNITNKPEINQRMTKTMLIKEYAEEIAKLRKELVASREQHGIYIDHENYSLMQERLQLQKDDMEEKQDRVQALTEEVEKIKLMFSDTENELYEKVKALAESEQKLAKTSKLLNVTCKTLSATTCQRDEQRHLVNRHSETEKSLSAQAKKLKTIVATSSSDADALHKKLLRKKHLEEKNKEQSESFQSQLQGRMAEFFETINNMTSSQEENFHSMLATLDSGAIQLEEESRKSEEVLLALLSCHEQEVSAQNDIIMQRKEELGVWTGDQLAQFSRHMSATSETESQYLTECNAPSYSEIKTLLNEQAKLMEQFKDKYTSVLQEEKKTMVTTRCKVFDAVSELKAGIHQLVDPKSADISYCHDTLQKISASEKDLFHNVHGICDELGKFVTYAASAKVKLNDQVLQIKKDFSQVSSKLDDIRQTDCTLSSMTQSSVRKIIADTEQLTTYASNASHLEAETRDFISKDYKSLSENLCKSLASMEANVAVHSDIVMKEFEIQQSHIAEAIQHIEDQSQKTFPEEKRDMEGLEQTVKDATELHKEVVTKHLSLRHKGAGEQKVKIHQSTQAISNLADGMNQFLLQQDRDLECFLHEDLLRDFPTGQTPQRREYSFPRTLVETSPHDKILTEFRLTAKMEETQNLLDAQMKVAQRLPIPDMDDSDKSSAHDTSFSSTASSDGSVGSKDSTTSTGKENSKKPKSRSHLPAPIKSEVPTPVQPLAAKNSNLINFD